MITATHNWYFEFERCSEFWCGYAEVDGGAVLQIGWLALTWEADMDAGRLTLKAALGAAAERLWAPAQEFGVQVST